MFQFLQLIVKILCNCCSCCNVKFSYCSNSYNCCNCCQQLLMTIIGLDLQFPMVNFQLLPTIIDDNCPGFPINYFTAVFVTSTGKKWVSNHHIFAIIAIIPRFNYCNCSNFQLLPTIVNNNNWPGLSITYDQFSIVANNY